MLDVLVKTTLLVGLAAALTRRSSHDSAADAHRLWLLVLVSPLLVLAVNAVLPPIAFLVPRGDLSRLSAPGVSGAWLAGIYAAVAVILLGRVAAGLWGVSLLRRRAQPLVGADLARVRALAEEPALDLREADLLVPVTAGVVRPWVILPRGWRALSPSALTAIVRHEAAHVRRKDCGLALVSAVVEAIVWVCPAVWIASARLRWYAEMACDAEAEKGMASGQYAAELLALSAGWAGARSPRYAITAGAETHVARRIRLLIDGMEQRSTRSALLPAAVIVVLLATVLSASLRVSASRTIDSPARGFDHGFAQSHQHGH